MKPHHQQPYKAAPSHAYTVKLSGLRTLVGPGYLAERVKHARTSHNVRNVTAAAQAAAREVKHASAVRYPRADLLQKSYTSKELAVRYGFPAISAPSPYWIATVELGGGWSSSDLQAYCNQLRIPVPHVQELCLPGYSDRYTGDPNSADGVVALDMQVIAGATCGLVNQLLVFAPNTSTCIADGLNAVAQWEGGQVSAVSLSWGSDEATWQDWDIHGTEAALQGLKDKNVPVFVASGDGGARDYGRGNNVSYPASSPSAFGCGGTTISPDGRLELAWSYGGGGLSAKFDRPEFQVTPNINRISQGMRCVPDGAMNADPNSGYTIILGGKQLILGGTSAVAPMFSAWKALTDSAAGAVLPFSAAAVYQLHDLTDIVAGNNGVFKAVPGYDLCTGEGVPNANFTEAWLAMNEKTESFAPGLEEFLALKRKQSIDELAAPAS